MSAKQDPFHNPMARARGLGSAKEGTHHFIRQRVTALILIPLSLWFVYSLLTLGLTTNSADILRWFDSPLRTLAMVLLLGNLFYHSALGLQVVIEDYVHGAFSRPAMLFTSYLVCLAGGIISIMAVLVMHFGEAVMVD